MICKNIDNYIQSIRAGPSSKEMLLAADYIEKKLCEPDVIVRDDMADKAIELIERYFEMTLLPWERFVISLVHCYYKQKDSVVFDEFYIMMGRGNGKNGFISGLAWYLTTHYHGVKGYNVDIIANSEDQAKTSFEDIYSMLTDTWDKSRYFFYKSKEEIRNLKTNSYIKYNTSNARTKDGKRSACLIFDERHEYENSEQIGVFSSGFGKRKHSRIFNITTNGYVRDGVLDTDLRLCRDVLTGAVTGLGLCPLIYKMDSEEECDNPELWVKANPSLPYFPELRKIIETEYIKKKHVHQTELDFYTKRMNLPRTNMDIAVAEWENIIATNKPIIDLTGRSCICGIDYASIRDFASVNLHFVVDGLKYDISHSWMCLRNPDIGRIRAPWKEWASAGLLTTVDEPEINPALLVAWICEQGKKYNIIQIQMDNFRLALLKTFLAGIGFDTERKNIKLVRPSDIARLMPVIESDFVNHRFVWGDNPLLRWAANNTCICTPGKSVNESSGNRYFAKIEPKTRKNDPFMALVSSMVDESMLGGGVTSLPPIGAIRL